MLKSRRRLLSHGAFTGVIDILCRHLLFLLFFPVIILSQKDPLVVQTTQGSVRGFTATSPHGKQVDAFLGIPYAQPPVGDLRFRPSVPKEPWQGIINTTKLPNSCYQQNDTAFGDFIGAVMWNPNTPISEDCLYINLWIPRPRPTNAVVMVWIYGGGFMTGTATLDEYDGSILAAEENVIVVSFQYRVGSLGFMYFGTDDMPGNAGLWDQVLALRWLKENVKAFGGNPNNVTIFGESAGASSVSLHLLAPPSRDLFNQAIMESGSATCPWATVTPEEALRRSLKLTKILGCRKDPVTQNLALITECLRKLAPIEFAMYELDVTGGLLEFPFVAVIDGDFLPQRPETILRNGQYKRCNVLLGSNSEEGSFFMNYHFKNFQTTGEDVSLSHEELINAYENAFYNFSRIAKDAIIFQYTDWIHPNDPTNNVNLLDKAIGDYFFTCNVNEVAMVYATGGQNVYMYLFNHRSSNMAWPKWLGVPHGYEIEYLFGLPLDPARSYTKAEADLARRMMAHWANFAKTGNPSFREGGGFAKHSWPVFTSHGKEYMPLNVKEPVIGRGHRATQCAFWKLYMPQLMSMTERVCRRRRPGSGTASLWMLSQSLSRVPVLVCIAAFLWMTMI
ncbi:acetylcholinesterase-like isoform X2 [Paramacrobiotus metropolitanus]|uniref:acetylcholinesterase-like isoform X2 n=1 Tax=Paramacrobiotus metropolitanus TaxID=2943436 RepID=UPI0024456583|nr:acetylcholinesterase-like isoform X2 [Paramacrobiotus metropolitanus]